MDGDFRRHQKLPGDEGFVYDVRKEFHPTEANDWDDSDDDDGMMNAEDGIYGDDDDAHVDMLP
jgi:centrosomal protein CEP19